MNYDILIPKLFWDYNKNVANKNYRRFNQKFCYYSNIYNFLLNRFYDSESILETLIRLVYNIFERPVCPICGNKLSFIGKPNNKGIYSKTCSKSCNAKLNINIQLNKNIESNIKKAKQTKKDKYGDENYNNRDKSKQTCLIRYNASSPLGNSEIINKGKKTKKERYGDEKYNNITKIKHSKLERYGDSSYVNKEKAKQTCLARYGETYFIDHGHNIKEILISKYGENFYIENSKKGRQTKKEKYGDENYTNKERAKETCLKKYNSKTWASSEIGRKTLSKLIGSSEIQEKINNTKKQHQTFNTSIKETESYKILSEIYSDVIPQYIDKDKYPFNCDFYIPSLDLFIECQYSWTHGNHPYNEILDKDKLLEWKEKAKKSNYYKNAINTWTIRDVKKRNIAKQNNLNYKEFWNIDELKKWIYQNKNELIK